MARVKGKAGGTLQKRLLRAALALLGLGLFTYLLIKLLAPWAGFLALPLTVLAVAKLLQDKEVERTVVATARGYLGEAQVGRVLEGLPEGFRVYHDVDLGGENADHVVVGPGGVFNVEVKNYSGHIQARPDGLYINGKRNDQVVRQAWRQAHKLRAWLGVEVEPVLVFVGGKLEGEAVGRLAVLRPKDLPTFLTRKPRRLSYGEARRIFELLERKTR